MKPLFVAAIVILIFVVGCTQTGIEMPAHKEISAQELKKLIDSKDNQDFFLVDVHIPEQKHIPKTDAVIAYNEIEKNKDKFPKDKDAKIALYCLGDPRFIARRMVIFSSEDVGNADPRALMVAVAAADAVEFVGLPEARINLSQAVIYLSLAPKSNTAYEAIKAATKDVHDNPNAGVPSHLQSTAYSGAKKLGHGVGYKYPHNFENAQVGQDYVPPEVKGHKYYKVKDSGIEKKLAERSKKPQ